MSIRKQRAKDAKSLSEDLFEISDKLNSFRKEIGKSGLPKRFANKFETLSDKGFKLSKELKNYHKQFK